MNRNMTAERMVVSLLFTGALFVASESFGAQPAREVSFSVDAKTSRDRNRSQQVEERANGSVTTTTDTETEICTLEVQIQNTAEQSNSCQLEWLFIGKRTLANGDNTLVVLDSGKSEMTLQKGSNEKKTISSKPFVLSERTIDRTRNEFQRDSGNSRRIRQGDTYAGYLVLLKAGGEILQKESNDDRFMRDEWIARCESAAKSSPEKRKKKN
jgi:hypothetical protein